MLFWGEAKKSFQRSNIFWWQCFGPLEASNSNSRALAASNPNRPPPITTAFVENLARSVIWDVEWRRPRPPSWMGGKWKHQKKCRGQLRLACTFLYRRYSNFSISPMQSTFDCISKENKSWCTIYIHRYISLYIPQGIHYIRENCPLLGRDPSSDFFVDFKWSPFLPAAGGDATIIKGVNVDGF